MPVGWSEDKRTPLNAYQPGGLLENSRGLRSLRRYPRTRPNSPAPRRGARNSGSMTAYWLRRLHRLVGFWRLTFHIRFQTLLRMLMKPEISSQFVAHYQLRSNSFPLIND